MTGARPLRQSPKRPTELHGAKENAVTREPARGMTNSTGR